MTSINDAFNNALLADATYALNTSGLGGYTGDDLALLLKGRMTPELAEYIGNNFTVVTHYESDDVLGSGFDATVWQRNSDGKYFVSMQGTAGLMDFVTDADLTASGTATAQIMDMVNWWLRITTPVGEGNASQYMYLSAPGPDLGAVVVVPALSADGEGLVSNVDSMEVVGHSLGGHLATVFARLFGNALPLDGVDTFNSAGFNVFSGILISQLAFWLGDGVSLDDYYQGQNNFYAENGISATHRDWLNIEIGNLIPLYNEESTNPVANHYMYKMTDLLALGDTLSMLDPGLSIETLNALASTGSNVMEGSLEGVLDAVRKLFRGTITSTDTGDTGDNASSRVNYYENLFELRGDISFSSIEGSVSIKSATMITAGLAGSDFSAFVSLHNLSPVYIDGASDFLQDVYADVYNQWSSGEFSSQYLEDRTAMLKKVLQANADDKNYLEVGGDTFYSDAETGISIGSVELGRTKIVFGDDGNNTLFGGDKNDNLYGGGGADTLLGGAGDDYLEGGSGNDVLNPGTGFDRLNGGAGNDTYQIALNNVGDAIISGDTDGGTIALLSGITFRKVGAGEANTNGLYIAVDENGDWISGKEGWSVSVSGSTATVSVKDSSGQQHIIAIENFNISNNTFGINFQKAPEVELPAPSNPFTVPDEGYLGAFTAPGNEAPTDIYFPNYRNAQNNELAVAASTQFDIEQYRNQSLAYNAVDYWGEWNANDMQWEPLEDHHGSTPYPGHPDEVLVITTAASRHGPDIMRFEGSNQDDVLYGNDWTSQMQAIKAWDDANSHLWHLDDINGFNPAIHGNNDVLFGLDGDDLLIGDGDQSVLSQAPGSQAGNRDILIGGRGSDVIYGMGGNDLIAGMEQYRTSWGAASIGLSYDPNKYSTLSEALFKNAFLYDPETQQETQTVIVLEDTDEKNYLDGGDGNDVIEGASFDDTIDGGNGSDWIYGGAGRDTIAGGAGDDEISGDSYAYFSAGLAFSDFIAPDELPEADDYSRAYFYKKDGDGVVLRYDFDKDIDYNDVIDGGAGNDLISGEIGSDIISGGSGDDAIFGDRMYGAGFFVGSGAPPANFQSLSKEFHGNDVVDGGDGNDLIVGGGGNDRLLGGNGNDTLYGDVGLDMIEFGMNTASQPAIQSSDDGWWGNDVLIGGAGNDVLVGEGNDDTLDGGDGDDYLYGDWANWQEQAFANTNSKAGNDTLYGGAGNDQLMGNSGNDTLVGGSGSDRLYGDSVSGAVFSGTGDDVLDGGEGNDFLYGGAGNDTLVGGAGNDYLDGGEGDDTYIFSAGNGVDTLDDMLGKSTLYLAAAPVRTVLQGSSAIIYLSEDGSNRIHLSRNALQQISHVYAGGEAVELNISIGSGYTGGMGSMTGNQTYTITGDYTGGSVLYDTQGENTLVFDGGWESGDGYLDVSLRGGSGYSIENAGNPAVDFSVSASAVAALADVLDSSGSPVNLRLATQTPSSDAANILYGFGGNDLINAYGGNDTVYGGGGNDTLYGGDGNDTLYGEEGNETLDGGAGDDTLYGGAGDDTLRIGAWSYYGDRISGGDGNDTIIADAGGRSQSVRGDAGSDTFVVNSSNNSFYQITDQYFDAGDVIQLDFNADRIHLTAKTIGIIAEDGLSVTDLVSFMPYTSPEDYWQGMENLTLRFADGTLWGIDEMRPIIQTATNLGDVLIGDAGANLLQGLGGNDTIYGADGDDTLYGNAGDDILSGGAGNDVFHFGVDDGQDVVREASGWGTDADVIWLESGVVTGNVSLSVQSDDLVLELTSGDVLKLDGFFDDAVTNVRNLSLSFNGNTSYAWNSEYIQKEIFKGTANRTQRGTPTTGNNSITGTSGNDYIYGDAGNDTLNGGNGSDWLDGGAGNDTLTGGSGSDTYRFGVGSGHDIVTDSAANIAADTVRLDFTVAMGDLTLQLVNGTSDLLIGRHDANGTVTDTIQVNKALGHLVDVKGNDLLVEEGGNTLLDVVGNGLVGKTLTLTWNPNDTRFVMLSASEILGTSVSDDERSRWQITGAGILSGSFLPDINDLDGDSDTTEPSFVFAENFWNSGTNIVGFIPSATAGDASFSFTLQRDDGLTIQSVMQVVVQTNTGTLTGTASADILDGSQSDTSLVITGGAGNDIIYDGYGNDTVYGGDGDDVLTYRWGGNGDDVLYGDAGNDTLDAGWGMDTMIGGTGHDLYIEGNLWSGDHTTIDNTGGDEGDVDTLQIGQGYGMWDYRSLWFTRDGNDLLVDQLDELEDGEIRIKDWYAATDIDGDGLLNDVGDGRLDIIVASQDDGAVYQTDAGSSNFDALVNAMAQFGAKPASVSEAASALQNEYQDAWTQIAEPLVA